MPEPSARDELVRVCGIPSGGPSLVGGIPVLTGGRRAGAYFVASFMLRTISKGAER